MTDEIEHSETSNENRSSWWKKQIVNGIAWLHIVVTFALFVCCCIQTAHVGSCSQETLYLHLEIALTKLAGLFTLLYAWWCDLIPYCCLRSLFERAQRSQNAADVQAAPRTPVDVGAAPGTAGQAQVASDKEEGVVGTILIILIALSNIAAEVVQLLHNNDPEKDSCTAKSTGPRLGTSIKIITYISFVFSAIFAFFTVWFFVEKKLERRANAQPAAQADIELQDMTATEQTEE